MFANTIGNSGRGSLSGPQILSECRTRVDARVADRPEALICGMMNFTGVCWPTLPIVTGIAVLYTRVKTTL